MAANSASCLPRPYRALTPRDEKDLEVGHKGRGAGAVENLDKRRGFQIEIVEAELAHAFRDEVLEDGVSAGAAEKRLIANKDVAGFELVRADFLQEALDRGKGSHL